MPLIPQSNTLVVTSHPPAWDELAAITCKTHADYCRKQGYDYHVDRSDLYDNYYDPHTQKHERLPIKGFVKLDLFLHFLPHYETVVWLDADSLITNPNIPVKDLIGKKEEIVMPYDWNGHNATTIINRSTDRVFNFWWACNNTGRKLFLRHDWVEMEASRYFSQTEPYLGLVTRWSIKGLCGILPQEYAPYVPERVMREYAWAPSDFCLHLSALPLTRRIELAKQYAP